MSLVWLSGPISGSILQPTVGYYSDQCSFTWGQRKPFIAGGSLATITCLIGLSYTDQFVRIATGSRDTTKSSYGELVVSIFFICALNISIQPVQGGLRALIIDNCPTRQQAIANAWASRLISIANVMSYLCNSLDLARLLPVLGETKLKALCTIVSLSLFVTTAITCLATSERKSSKHVNVLKEQKTTFTKIKMICDGIRGLPPRILIVFEVQFFSWIAWFSFLTNITS